MKNIHPSLRGAIATKQSLKRIRDCFVGISMLRISTLLAMTIFFASVSGLWGVLVTDSLQFVITMSGTFVLAYFALQHPAVGGLQGLFSQVDPKLLNVMPDFSDWTTSLAIFIIPITVQWWSVWYPRRGQPSPPVPACLQDRCDGSARRCLVRPAKKSC